eukprot:CAMPEP_0206257350 /NCGR_PEP_ID=MMETSP0047_2-20121206/25292_1 /ASSEMBLY_ACC=CAM_ASM_000192 /TAXON_ID=195065 /ORGANISM="Chroomonas mesostigmatica_cf, Strain CCMP1168" /LENGTH=59 /DNA_ID=CAMNT_0053683927 /DNA_START=1213 /DNA_END=1389 /DNA_ORIENTATION=-
MLSCLMVPADWSLSESSPTAERRLAKAWISSASHMLDTLASPVELVMPDVGPGVPRAWW